MTELIKIEKGRGAVSNGSGRYERLERILQDDGWESLAELPKIKTEITLEAARHIITRNTSPDISFDRSINPYRGCEHGCIYCFSRPTHAYMGLSPGIDFESRLFSKPNAADLLRKELAKPGYKAKPIAIGTNTDPYQPIEREQRLMRQLLEVLLEHKHPVLITTKSAMVGRDLDVLQELAKNRLVEVRMSVTTLNGKLARAMEPRASTPQRRLTVMKALSEAGVPVAVAASPMIPALNDHELESILEAAAKHGATCANYIVLRVPLEVRDLFKQWLHQHYPDRFKHVLSVLRTMRGGADYDSRWGHRMRGTGPYSDMLARRFELACEKLGLKRGQARLRNDLFSVPNTGDRQLDLFGT
ncbi:MAG: PA0069 family radical SAM protein [Pseudomonadota bacterium]